MKTHGPNCHVEAMTDQIDVYSTRKIGTYMA